MHISLIKEYEQVRAEIVSVQGCITTYMQMFYGAAAASVGIFGLAVGRDLSAVPSIFAAYIPLFLAYVVLFFTTVVFHKFNSHNRYAGYARALTQECWAGEDRSKDEMHLWESVVASIYKSQNTFEDLNFPADKEKVDSLIASVKNNCSEPPWRAKKKAWAGIVMMSRATIHRAKTYSWTFPFQVAFAPFASTIILLGIWFGLIIVAACWSLQFGLNLAVQTGLVLYLLASWLGLGYRLYRLCDDDGDRTIEAYCLDSMATRHAALKKRDITVTYITYPLRRKDVAAGADSHLTSSVTTP